MAEIRIIRTRNLCYDGRTTHVFLSRGYFVAPFSRQPIPAGQMLGRLEGMPQNLPIELRIQWDEIRDVIHSELVK